MYEKIFVYSLFPFSERTWENSCASASRLRILAVPQRKRIRITEKKGCENMERRQKETLTGGKSEGAEEMEPGIFRRFLAFFSAALFLAGMFQAMPVRSCGYRPSDGPGMRRHGGYLYGNRRRDGHKHQPDSDLRRTVRIRPQTSSKPATISAPSTEPS